MSSEKELSIYDASKEYRDKIQPLVEEIKKICTIDNIPFFFSCAVKNSDKGTDYENDGVLTGGFGISLYDDKFPQFLGVMNGGRVVFNENEDSELSSEIASALPDEDLNLIEL